MKKLIILLILMVGFTTSINTAERDTSLYRLDAKISYDKRKSYKDAEMMEKLYSKGLENFLDHLAQKESSGNYKVVNSYGYIGKYQFGRAALKEVGYSDVTTLKFKKDPSIFPEEAQDTAVVKLMKINHSRLENLIMQWEGKTINGIEITESGLLAAAHLAGAGGVKRFLKSGGNYNPADGYGTRLTKYLKEFQNYKINLNYA
jgi:hypothetical protein